VTLFGGKACQEKRELRRFADAWRKWRSRQKISHHQPDAPEEIAFHERRGGIERAHGVLASFGGGLSPLPAWVRHRDRVWMWSAAKLVINGVRIVRNKRLAAK
jgi:hypothetical protein